MSHNLLACYIPAFDPGNEFEETLSSLSISTVKPFVLVVDDCSPNPIIIDFEGLGLKGEVLRLEENGGHFRASNIALRELHKRGYKYVARLDADDVVMESRFSEQIQWLEENPTFNMVASAAITIDEHSIETGIWPAKNGADLLKAMAENSVICHPTIMQRGDYIERVGPYRELRRAADYEYLMRAVVNGELYVLDKPLLRYRVHQKSLSFTNYRGQILARLATQRRYLGKTGIHGLRGLARSLAILAAVTLIPKNLAGPLRRKFGMKVKTAHQPT